MDQQKYQCLLIIGNIYTQFQPIKKVECFVVQNGKFLFSGSLIDAKSLLLNMDIKTDFSGVQKDEDYDQQFDNFRLMSFSQNKMIMPGFIDSHCHPISGATQHDNCRLQMCSSWQEASTQIKQYLKQNEFAENKWIYIYGYSQSWFNDIEQRIEALDEIFSKNPMVIMRDDCHSYWSCKITKESKIPLNGVVSLDSNGQFNGSFAETAMNMIREHFPKRTNQDHIKTLDSALNILAKYGVVGFCDAAVKETLLETYLSRYASDDNKPWAYLCLCWNQLFLDQTQKIAQDVEMNFVHLDQLIENYQSLVKSDKINPQELMCKSVKLFIDGVVESNTALLREPYCNCSKIDLNDQNGTLMIQIPQLEEILKQLSLRTLQAHMHCIGDASTDIIVKILNNIELNREVRNYIAHLQFVSEDSLNQFHNLNLGANFSPLWFYEDPDKSVLNQFINQEMIQSMYPIKPLLEQKVKIGFGSDWPVSSLNPLDGIERATTRQPLGHTGAPIPIGNIDQIISLEQALHIYTLGLIQLTLQGSAWLLHNDQQTGTIEEGKRADFICLDQDLFQIQLSQISQSRVIKTFIKGQIVFDDDLQK